MLMNRFHRQLAPILASLLLAGLASGCGQSRAPKEIAAKDISAESQSLFGDAAPEIKELAIQAGTALQAREWATAYAAFQTLSQRQDLTAEQREFVGGSLIALGNEIQKASDAGDAQAQAVRQIHSATK
jgi:hypothetical protein